MKTEEAIVKLNIAKRRVEYDWSLDYFLAIEEGIKALEERRAREDGGI